MIDDIRGLYYGRTYHRLARENPLRLEVGDGSDGASVDSLSSLSVFVRAAETRSFTGAGRQLNVSSSAVGKAISRLEDRLGVRLFHRSTRAITLTSEGELFLDSCRRIFSEIAKIEPEFARSKGSPKGRFKVSLPLVGMLIMPTLQGF